MPGFSQTFRFTNPDGTTSEAPTRFLQQCGNDVLRTGGLTEDDVIFEPEVTVVTRPEVTAPAGQAAPVTLMELASAVPSGAEPISRTMMSVNVEVGVYQSGSHLVAQVVSITEAAGRLASRRSRKRAHLSRVAGTDGKK